MESGLNVLVIGGTKFVDPHLVSRLATLGHSVTVYHRGENEAELPKSVRHVHDPGAAMPVRTFPAALLTPPPEIVIHMIAMGEDDATAAVEAFRGRISRKVWLSSGDVYRAYGRFSRIEPAPIEEMPRREDSPLRSVLYPHRQKAKSKNNLEYYYEKLFIERAALGDPKLPSVILRLPKIYGPGSNSKVSAAE